MPSYFSTALSTWCRLTLYRAARPAGCRRPLAGPRSTRCRAPTSCSPRCASRRSKSQLAGQQLRAADPVPSPRCRLPGPMHQLTLGPGRSKLGKCRLQRRTGALHVLGGPARSVRTCVGWSSTTGRAPWHPQIGRPLVNMSPMMTCSRRTCRRRLFVAGADDALSERCFQLLTFCLINPNADSWKPSLIGPSRHHLPYQGRQPR